MFAYTGAAHCIYWVENIMRAPARVNYFGLNTP